MWWATVSYTHLAGKKGAITSATNMAGRGTEIMLGGNAEFMAKAQMRKEHFCENLLNPDAPQDADPAAVELLLTEDNGHGETCLLYTSRCV